MTSTVQAFLFTSPTCPYCPAAKSFAQRYFPDKEDVKFKHMSAATPEGQQKAMEFGVRGVPTFVLVGPGYPQPIGASGTPSKEHMDKLIALAKGDISPDDLR